MFIHFFCLCPLGLAIKQNFNIVKVACCENSSVGCFFSVELLVVSTVIWNCQAFGFVLWLVKKPRQLSANQMPFSSPEAAILLVSTKNRDFLSIRRVFVLQFSANQIRQIWKSVRYSRTSVVGGGQRSRFLVLTKRIVASGNENGQMQKKSQSRREHAFFLTKCRSSVSICFFFLVMV